jgi:hypothetical protein
MKKRYILLTALCILAFLVSVPALLFILADSGNPQEPMDQRILGSWFTTILLSELASTVTRVTFDKDGSYKWTSYLLYLVTSERGTYKITGDRLTLSTSGHHSKKTLSFQNKNLIITEEDGYRYYFRRIFKLK